MKLLFFIKQHKLQIKDAKKISETVTFRCLLRKSKLSNSRDLLTAYIYVGRCMTSVLFKNKKNQRIRQKSRVH